MTRQGINFRQKNGNYKNGRTKERGYVLIRAYTHPFAPKRGYVRFHRYMLEIYYSIKFGIPVYILPKFFDIHHINGIKDDNRIENLQLLSRSAHTTITNSTKSYIHKRGNTLCFICHKKTNSNKKGYEFWKKYKGNYICQKCHYNLTYVRKRKLVFSRPAKPKILRMPKSVKIIKEKKKKMIPRKWVKPIRVCILCKTKTSITGKRSMWYKYRNFDICIKCNGLKRRKYNNPFIDVLSKILIQ